MWWHTVTHGRGREGVTGEWSGYPVHFTLPRNMVYPALLSLIRTPRLPVVDWTDTPADLNGLVRFSGRRNLVSARVPSHFKTHSTVSSGVYRKGKSVWVFRFWYTSFWFTLTLSGTQLGRKTRAWCIELHWNMEVRKLDCSILKSALYNTEVNYKGALVYRQHTFIGVNINKS